MGTTLGRAVEIENVLVMTAISFVAVAVWFYVMASTPVPLEAEGFADEADGFVDSDGMQVSDDPRVRQAARMLRQRRDAAVMDAAAEEMDSSAMTLPVHKRLLQRTRAGPMRVTVFGCMPADSALRLLLVSNPGADWQACYGPFLSRAAAQLPTLRSAAIVCIDLPGQLPVAEYAPEPSGKGDSGAAQSAAASSDADDRLSEEAALPAAPALVPFGSLASAVCECAAAVGCDDAIGVAAHAGAWLLLSAQVKRPGLLRGLIAGGLTTQAPGSGEAATLASLGWSLSTRGWTPWARETLSRSMLSDSRSRAELGAAIRTAAPATWHPQWVSALLAGWSARPSLREERELSEAVLGSEAYTSASGLVLGGASALEVVVLLQNAVPGGGVPLCDGSPDPAVMDKLQGALNRLFGSKGLGGAASLLPVPGGPLSLSESPHKAITPLRMMMMSLGYATE